jgi:hypothetical protein
MAATEAADTELQRLADARVLGALLDVVRERWGAYELLDHWQQGEFHHDVVLHVPGAAPLVGGPFLVVATNCNGGVKEVLTFDARPDRWALWHWRCPQVADFAGDLPPVRGRAVTEHWFDPCELLGLHARSELRPEFRVREPGGGWSMRPAACNARKPEG